MKVKVAKQDVKRFNEIIADFTEWMKEFTPEEEPEKLQEIEEFYQLDMYSRFEYATSRKLNELVKAVNQLVKERDENKKMASFLNQQKAEVVEKLQKVIDVQGHDGNWNFDPYMRGMYNGLALAKSILTDTEPEYKSEPKKNLHIIKKVGER